MSSQHYIMKVVAQNVSNNEEKVYLSKEKVMSYEEKSVGSTPFFQCEACPYMALAEDDIKFHLFTDHPDLAKRNGLADNIRIPCPGCTSVFDAEETLRTHLRNHHKMGVKDIRKMVKSLVRIALKNAKLIKNVNKNEESLTPQPEIADVKIPQVIEIVPDIVHAKHEQLPKGVAFISVDELNKMSTPNFEKVDPKEVIQEASINIVYTTDVSTQYVNMSNASSSNSHCNLIPMSSVTPDLISSIPRMTSTTDNNLLSPPPKTESSYTSTQENGRNLLAYPCTIAKKSETNEFVEDKGSRCAVSKCYARLKDPNNLSYHRKCHQNSQLICPECTKIFLTVQALHMHLWKAHSIDLELHTCNICGYKTYKKYRLLNIHMKCHSKLKEYSCTICLKKFKNSNQLSKHRVLHKRNEDMTARCHICERFFASERQLRHHVAAVHEKLKPFKCCNCDYTAARKEELKLHMRSHTGDKPYACDQCNYCTGDHNALRRHKKQHSQESVYKCKYCPYTAIQSTMFASHMISKHPNVSSEDVHCCSYCPFKTVNKEKYHRHLITHRGNGDILLVKMPNSVKTTKPSWTIPSETSDKPSEVQNINSDQNKDCSPKTVNTIPIEVFDCDSLPESIPQEYPKSYCNATADDVQQSNYNTEVLADFTKDDNNSDCLISENYDIPERHQYNTTHPLQLPYEPVQPNLHFLNTSASMDQGQLQNNSINSLASNHSPISNSLGGSILSNFPIRLPPPPLSVRNNITLQPVNTISAPVTKVTGPIINQMQILPITSSSHSPISISKELEGAPRKKPKISVKSNLILKGPDQVNMFHSQQKMAFKRLEDNERFGLGGPVTFNNLITTQFMQLQPEPAMSESPNNIITYPQDNMLEETSTTPVGSEMNENPQIFSFNQQMNVNSMTLLPPPQKIQTNDPSYIKLEGTIKQNTQSPSLEKMCNANILNNPAISREYKASPPLEDIHKNMNEIKNEVKSDAFYNMSLNRTPTNPPIVDQYMIDNIIPDQYPAHLDLSTVVLPEISDQQNDVIEIDDNSDDNKLLPRFDMNFSLESLYLMHNDFHFLENDINNMSSEAPVNEINRMVAEIPVVNPKDNADVVSVEANSDNHNFIQGKKDPMMNTSVRPSTNKINVKNIELMKN